MILLAIDPGNVYSAFVIYDTETEEILDKGKVENTTLLPWVGTSDFPNCRVYPSHLAIECVESHGMPVGATVFDTCIWIGRFIQAWVHDYMIEPFSITRIYRMQEKMAICHSPRANDASIRQALIDKFGPPGTKNNPGKTYGISKDVWQALSVAVTYQRMYATIDLRGLDL